MQLNDICFDIARGGVTLMVFRLSLDDWLCYTKLLLFWAVKSIDISIVCLPVCGAFYYLIFQFLIAAISKRVYHHDSTSFLLYYPSLVSSNQQAKTELKLSLFLSFLWSILLLLLLLSETATRCQSTFLFCLHRNVQDIDLFSAGLAEYPLPGAAVGPTFTCIIGIQFYNLKYGDRFWFEHGYQSGSFTPGE